MNDLAIRVNYDADRPTVIGRDLHAFLGVETAYKDWFPRMCEYGFAEDSDYSSFLSHRSDGLPGKPRTDHQLTVDMAKELCMLQRTERGKQCRQYFLELERQWNTPEAVMSRALRMANAKMEQLAQRNDRLIAQAALDQPLVIFAKSVETSKQSILVGELAKLLKQNGVEIGQNRLFERLREEGFLCKGGEQYNMPTQRAMELGLFEIKERTINNPDGSVRLTRTSKVTGKGQIYFVNKFRGRETPCTSNATPFTTGRACR